MKIYRLNKLKGIPLFLFLLPLFFVLHGLSEHLFFIPVTGALILFLKYLAAAVLLFILFWFFFRNILKASLTSAFTLFIYFFFGALHDFIKEIPFVSFLGKYSVLLPILLALYLFVLWRIKKSVQPKLIFYLNFLFILLLTFDSVKIIRQLITHKTEKLAVLSCPDCKKPDVYLILLDGYAGQRQLVRDFSFSNEVFLRQLEQLGFYVLDSSFSNYGDTPFSMSSMLNMEYLSLKDYRYSDDNLNYCYEQIANNKVVRIFERLGYEFVNNSIFDIQGQTAPINKTFLISGVQLITSQTLAGRFRRDVYNNIVGKYFPNSSLNKSIVFSDLKNNENIYDRTIEAAEKKSGSPRFIYSHLLMPHFPYYYNNSGVLNPFSLLTSGNLYNDSLYLGYLRYCNKYISDLIVSIQKKSQKPPVILLISDHGYRKGNNYDTRYFNLSAVYLPDGNYSGYRNNLSNINQFPVLFNRILNQKIPLRKDKIVE